MAFTFPTSLFPDVRAAIGLDVDENSLPDTTLALPVYKKEAERYIERKLTEAQYTGEWEDEARYAATLYMASLAVPGLRVVDAERFPGGNITFAKVDLAGIAARLAEQAAARINDIVKATTGKTAATNINVFTKAPRRDLTRF